MRADPPTLPKDALACYACGECGAVVGESPRTHHEETGHDGFVSRVRTAALTKEQQENVEKHGVPIYTVVMPDGSHIRLFAETAHGIHGYGRYNDLDGSRQPIEGEPGVEGAEATPAAAPKEGRSE